MPRSSTISDGISRRAESPPEIWTYSGSGKNFQSDIVGDTLAQCVAVITPRKEVGKLVDVGRVVATHGSLIRS